MHRHTDRQTDRQPDYSSKEVFQELKNAVDLENEKRKAEAEAIKKKIQMEKDALRAYIDNDNKALR